ncbi:MAG TPA: LysR family transcriptional regulator [Steroidobacteraceae bacterium]|nr:LysR family transcriptional regulator [Steroidobacteraceae bacterium]
MDLSSLSAFVKIVQSGSFTRAAESLGSHKAHVSRSIAQLERKLGIRLLERTTRRVRLTDVGQQVYEQALNIMASVADIEATAASLRGEPAGTLRLSADVEFGLSGLSRWIDGFAQKHPQVGVDVELTTGSADLIREGFDLALRMGSIEGTELTSQKLGEVAYGLYASPGYLEKSGTPGDGDAVSQHPLLMYSASPQRGWRLTTLSRELRIDGPARLRANNSGIAREAALRGLGIALLPAAVAKEDVTRGTLRRVLSAWSGPKVPVFALFPPGRQHTPRVHAFIEIANSTPLT